MKEEHGQPESKPEVEISDFEKIYVDIKTPGIVYRHKKVNLKASDAKAIDEIARQKAQCGCTVHILPELHPQDDNYNNVFNGAKEGKCPDLLINGIFTEVKTINNLHAKKISGCIKNAYEQSEHVIIALSSDFNIKRLGELANGRFKTHSSLQVVEFKIGKDYHTFNRP